MYYVCTMCNTTFILLLLSYELYILYASLRCALQINWSWSYSSSSACIYLCVCCSVPGSRWWAGWSRAADWLRFGPLEAAGGFGPRAAADGCSPPWHSAARRATTPPRYRSFSAESAAGAPVTWGGGREVGREMRPEGEEEGRRCAKDETRKGRRKEGMREKQEEESFEVWGTRRGNNKRKGINRRRRGTDFSIAVWVKNIKQRERTKVEDLLVTQHAVQTLPAAQSPASLNTVFNSAASLSFTFFEVSQPCGQQRSR